MAPPQPISTEPGATFRFEGADHGSPLSAFIVDAGTGEGPALHWHSYVETFIVLSGHARFRRGDDHHDDVDHDDHRDAVAPTLRGVRAPDLRRRVRTITG